MALVEFKREQSIDEAFRKFGYNSDIRLRAQKVYANNTPVAASFDLILKRDLT